jgi:integrase
MDRKPKTLEGTATPLDAAILFMKERERVRQLTQIPTVNEAIDAYLNAKRLEEQKGEISRQTLYDIESKMRIIRETFGERKVIEIDEAAVRTFIRQLPYAARTRVNIRTKLSQFLNYCRRERKWIAVNPTENIKVRVKNAEVEILTVPEVRQLLSAAQSCELQASVIPYLAVQLFAGLRPFEAAQLRWERIHFDTKQIEVRGETSKTRETRFVEMEPLLTQWLLPFRLSDGPITGPRFARTLQAVKAAAGFSSGARPWPIRQPARRGTDSVGLYPTRPLRTAGWRYRDCDEISRNCDSIRTKLRSSAPAPRSGPIGAR